MGHQHGRVGDVDQLGHADVAVGIAPEPVAHVVGDQRGAGRSRVHGHYHDRIVMVARV